MLYITSNVNRTTEYSHIARDLTPRGHFCGSGRGMYVKIQSLGGVLSGSLSAVKPNFVRKSEVRKMKEKMRKRYVTENMEIQHKKVSLQC